MTELKTLRNKAVCAALTVALDANDPGHELKKLAKVISDIGTTTSVLVDEGENLKMVRVVLEDIRRDTIRDSHEDSSQEIGEMKSREQLHKDLKLLRFGAASTNSGMSCAMFEFAEAAMKYVLGEEDGGLPFSSALAVLSHERLKEESGGMIR